MHYAEFPPPRTLYPFVKCIWMLANERGGTAPFQRVAPDGCVELVFQLGDPFERLIDAHVERQPRLMIVGPSVRHVLIRATGIADVLGVRLHPGGLAAFTHCPAVELVDTMPEASDVIPEAREWCEQLAQVPFGQVRATLAGELLSRALRRRSEVRRERAALAALLAQRLVSERGARRCDIIARDAAISHRQLDRLFATYVGVRPRTLGRLARFQRAIALLEQPTVGGWSAIAIKAGYFDQPHLIREFREFAGVTPSRYIAEQHPMSDAFGAADHEDLLSNSSNLRRARESTLTSSPQGGGTS